jgi:hypothetical protein
MSTFPPALLALSDNQLTIVMAMAEPLPPDLRSDFLEAVARQLAGQGELGDGLVSRTCRALVRQYFDPPDLTRGYGLTRHGRT